MTDIHYAIRKTQIETPKKVSMNTYRAIEEETFVYVIMNKDTLFNKVMKLNPKYTKERLANKFLEMGLTTDEKEAESLVESALTTTFPYPAGSKICSFYEIEKKGETLYQLRQR